MRTQRRGCDKAHARVEERVVVSAKFVEDVFVVLEKNHDSFIQKMSAPLRMQRVLQGQVECLDNGSDIWNGRGRGTISSNRSGGHASNDLMLRSEDDGCQLFMR